MSTALGNLKLGTVRRKSGMKPMRESIRLCTGHARARPMIPTLTTFLSAVSTSATHPPHPWKALKILLLHFISLL